MPGSDVQRGPHRVRVAADGGESVIEFQACPHSCPVKDARDLSVSDTFEATEHQHSALEFRQPVVCGEDATEFLGYALDALSAGQPRRLGGL